MADVSFIFTNPGHHLDMMAPVVRELAGRGTSARLISLAELRGLRTPAVADLTIKQALPLHLRRHPSVGSNASGARPQGLRALARSAVSALLRPWLLRLVGDSRLVVIPNDIAFPYRDLVAALRVPVVLMQEGIRFAMPCGDEYGLGDTERICAWGEGSRDHFLARGVPAGRIAITGSPRHDTFDVAAWRERGARLRDRLGLRERPLVMMSNPIETQGYGTRADKLARFAAFVRGAEPVLRARGIPLVVKNHAFEDPDEFAAIAAATPARDLVHVVPGPLFETLAIARAAVVLTSTAGLEALLFDVPIAALELPDGTFGFEYVERGAAVGLRADAIAAGLDELLDTGDQRRQAGRALVARHLYERGRATANVAEVIERELVVSAARIPAAR